MSMPKDKVYKRIFLLGPSHHEWLDGASVNMEADYYARRENTHNVFFNGKAALEAKVDEAFAKWAMPNEQLRTLCSFKSKN